LQGPASKLLVQQAQTRGCNLIVMSSQGQTGLAGALLGSVACTVVRESDVPVLVIRERVALPQDARELTVLVPLDGSALAEAVIEPLLPLARTLGWRLQLLWVVDLPPGDALAQEVPLDQRAKQERPSMVAYLEQVAERIRGTGVPAEVRIDSGDRGDCIVRCAEPDDVDLIAMSTHGRHGIGRLVLGSVAEHVISHASKPVFAVRPNTV
jgi:nucleotide-binding universal stress UspA family protein